MNSQELEGKTITERTDLLCSLVVDDLQKILNLEERPAVKINLVSVLMQKFGHLNGEFFGEELKKIIE
jgi:hypothetical protein